jgi:hypothetical protein
MTRRTDTKTAELVKIALLTQAALKIGRPGVQNLLVADTCAVRLVRVGTSSEPGQSSVSL